MESAKGLDIKPIIESVWNENFGSQESIPKSNLIKFLDTFIEKSKISLTKEQLISICDNEIPNETLTKEDLINFFESKKDLPIDKANLEAIRVQIEYYFSDGNLRRDKYFSELINNSPEGYIDTGALLKCKRLIQLNTNEENIKEALRESSEVEVHPDGIGVRRIGNRKLPPLQSNKKASKIKEIEISPIIFKVEVPEECKASWKNLRDTFKEKYRDIEIIYARFSGKEGNIGIPGNISENKVEDIVNEGMQFEEQNARVWKLEGDDLLDFWKAHGSHFELCNQSKRIHIDKRKAINIGGKFFQNLDKLKEFLKTLLDHTPEGQNVDPQYHNLLHELLRRHPSYENKSAGLKTFATGISKQNDQKSFVVVKYDGSHDDFSISKCLSQL